ncbi:unnamed protein product, partial [Ectocarpus sp. 12 AP-2014]
GAASSSNALGSLLQTFKVASFAQVEAPAEDPEVEVAEEGGPATSSGRHPGSSRRDSAGTGDQDASATVDMDVSGDGKEEDGAAGGEDGVLPGGPALFGERPADSGAGWEEILAKSYKEHQTSQAARLGRGKREKTQVRPYAAEEDEHDAANHGGGGGSSNGSLRHGEEGREEGDEEVDDDDDGEDDMDEYGSEQPDAEFEPPTSKAAA